MIYTVTLNPALDYVIQVENFQSGKINRVNSEAIVYGGKGINVSYILNELNIQSTSLGFVAGFTGESLDNGLNKTGIITDFIHVKEGMTRINVKMKSEDETEINGMGPNITSEDISMLMSKIKKLGEGDTIVLAGSIPYCMDPNIYEQIISELDPKVNIVVDAEKELLFKILKYKPFLIKPNNIELGDMFDVTINGDDDIVYYARKLQAKGARNVLVSMAKDGAILVDENDIIHKIGVAEGKLVNSVGAGDSMVAGFIAGYNQKKDYDYALKLGTACGGATAFHLGLATNKEIYEVFNTL